MTERRPFPPSPRRLALARQAGTTAASPLVVSAAALGAAVIASVMLARAAGKLIGSWIAASCRAAALPAPDTATAVHGASALPSDAMLHGTGALSPDAALHGASTVSPDAALHGAGALLPDALHGTSALPFDASTHAANTSLGLDGVLPRLLELVAPLVIAAAIAALVAHVAQTRALWLPRRRIAGAPVVPPARVARTTLDMIATAVVGAVAFGWLWTTAPRLAALFAISTGPASAPRSTGAALDNAPAAVGAALASLGAALAIAWVALAALDALVRRAQLARALAMTVAEKREDDRLTAADPRWRARRRMLARTPVPSAAIARSALLLLGDDIAVAIAWDARRQPIPLRTIVGRGARATQLLGLARRYRVAVHRDAQLATALADDDGPVPDAHWARLAEIIAAVQPSHTGAALSR